MIRAAIVAVALASLLAAPAHGQDEDALGVAQPEIVTIDRGVAVPQRQLPLRLSGSVTVEFRGDPAAGCESVGVCGLEGVIVWTPPAAADLLVAEPRRRFRYVSSWTSDAASRTVAQVTRAGGGRCTDARRLPAGGTFAPRGRRPTRISFPDTTGPPALGSDPLSTRCAGPLPSDLRGALPSARLDPAMLRRGRGTLDLRGERPFAAHGFAGTVRSVLTVRIGRARPLRGSPGPSRGPRRFRMLTASYAIERIDGALTTTFAGAADPDACGALDACGVTGTIASRPGRPRDDTLTITAVAPRRTAWRDLRAALGLARPRRRSTVQLFGSGAWTGGAGGGTEAAIARTDGSPPCLDRAPSPGGVLALSQRAGGIRIEYAGLAEILRTRCPGPRHVAPGPMLATGTLSPSALRRSRPVLRVTRGVALSDDGYAGSTTADLTFRLRRTSVRRDAFTG